MTNILRCTLTLAVVLLATAAFAQEQGRWNAQFHPDKFVYLMLQTGMDEQHGMNQRSLTLPLARLQNLNFTPGSASTNAHFEIKAEAGTINFNGVASDDTGAGKYSFTPDRAFNKAMADLGFFVDPDRQLSFVLHDVTVAYAKAMRAATGVTDGDLVLKMARLEVNTAYVENMSKLFSKRLGAEEVIDLAKHDVTADYVQKISQALGQKLGVQEVVDLAKHDVTPEYLAKMSNVFGQRLGTEEVVDLAKRDVTPEYVQQVSQAYGQKLTPDDISTASRHEVTPEYIVAVHKLLPAAQFDDIDSLHKRDVSVDFITAAQKCHSGISAEEIENLKRRSGSPCGSME